MRGSLGGPWAAACSACTRRALIRPCLTDGCQLSPSSHIWQRSFHSVAEDPRVRGPGLASCCVFSLMLAHGLCLRCDGRLVTVLVASVSGGPGGFKGAPILTWGGHCLSSGAWGGAELDLRAPGRLRPDGAQAPPCWGRAGRRGPRGSAAAGSALLTYLCRALPSLFLLLPTSS